MEILVDAKKPFIVGTQSIAKLNIAKINFLQYAECFKARLREMSKSNDDVAATKAFMRARRLKQAGCTPLHSPRATHFS